MDDLDKQLAELQLITKGELKTNPNAEVKKPIKKIGPAVPPKPKKPQVYSNLPTIGVPKPYEKPADLSHSVYGKDSPHSTYANQDGLIYSNILHESKTRNVYSANDFPPPPLDLTTSEYVQCNIPPSFPPPPVPNDLEVGRCLLDDGLPPPPPPITANLYAPLSTSNSQRQAASNSTGSPYQSFDDSNFYKAQPQVPTNYNKYNVYSNIPNANHDYSNIELNNENIHTYENTRLHPHLNSGVGSSSNFDSHNSVLNYPGSSISDYENQTEIMENRAFRSGSSASRVEYVDDSDTVRGDDNNASIFRSASSASNYMGYVDRYNDHQSDSIYAPLSVARSVSTDNNLPPPPPIMGVNASSVGDNGDGNTNSGVKTNVGNIKPPNLPPIIMCGVSSMNDSLADDMPAPASPVSSSYSELRRATDLAPHHHNLYNPYNPPSHISSTYESIYEPINPRPSSQNSTRSGYSLYGQNASKLPSVPVNNGSSTTTGISTSSGKVPTKELEVDKLTNLLVQGLDSVDQDDVYGICVKCNTKIVGEENGCTAMDNFYHINCFTCSQCDTNLQGKPFYSLDGKPYCEQDYLNTLEKCSVCVKPILDRILRATGKPYHPKCFTCVVCNKSLDGVPFTVDATNQIHCIEDFHKKFAPRCCVCKLPIMPEQGEEETVRVVALDRSFHIGCYKCEDCGLVLSSEAEGRGCYPLDGHVLCKSCNALRVQALTQHMTTDL